MANVITKAKELHKISKMSLQDIEKTYGEGPIFYKELVRRSKKNLEEIRRYYREAPEFDWSDFQDRCKLLKLSIITVLQWDNIKEIPNFISEAYLYDRTDWLETPITKKVSNNFLKTMLSINDFAYKYPQLIDLLTANNCYSLLINPKIDPLKIPNICEIVSKLPKEYIKKLIEYFMIMENYDFLNELNKNIGISKQMIIYLFDENMSLPLASQINIITDMPDDFISDLLNSAIEKVLEKLDLTKLEMLLSSKFYTLMTAKEIQKLTSDITYKNYPKELVDSAWKKIISKNESKVQVGIDQMLTHNLDKNGNVPSKMDYPEFVIDDYLSSLFSSTIPQEIKEEFKRNGFTRKYLLSHQEFAGVFKTLPLNILFKTVYVFAKEESSNAETSPVKLTTFLERNLGYEKAYEILLSYIDYFPTTDSLTINKDMLFFEGNTLEEILDTLNTYVKNCLEKGIVQIDEHIHASFKEKYSHMFIDRETPEELKNSFYQKELEASYFISHREDLRFFRNTNIAYGLKNAPEALKNIKKFSEDFDINAYILDILDAYETIEDEDLKPIFINFISSSIDALPKDFIDLIANLYNRLSKSQNKELLRIKKIVAKKIIESSNPEYILNVIEVIMSKEDIPYIAKIYNIFETTNRGLTDFDFSKTSKTSPILKSLSSATRQVTIFADLIKISLGSNNRSFKNYITMLEEGDRLFKETDSTSFDSLDTESKNTLIVYISCLEKLYNNMENKKEHFKKSGNVLFDLTALQKLFTKDGKIESDIPDKIVNMYCHFAGFDTLASLKIYIGSKTKKADIRNRMALSNAIKLKRGDFLKNIGNIEDLGYILQNGILAESYMMKFAKDICTPLDTELLKVEGENRSLEETIADMESHAVGSLWVVFKNDERFVETRKDTIELPKDINKLEVYENETGTYGLRTGIASSEIDCFIVREFDQRIGLEIALNGFYIPVIDTKGRVLFTIEDYDMLRNKINGITYLSNEPFHFSHNLLFSGIEDILKSIKEIDIQKYSIMPNSKTAIESKLNSIRSQDIEKYKLVLANIELAKRQLEQTGNVLSEECIENWILSNGGSYIDAAKDFLKNSSNKDFASFKNDYAIWNFDERKLGSMDNGYNHHNFIDDLDEQSYQRLNSCLSATLDSVRIDVTEDTKAI